MPKAVMSVDDVRLVEFWKGQEALLPICPKTVERCEGAIVVMCNSGRQIVDRVTFLEEHVTDVPHLVLSHGGVMRLSPRFFDGALYQGVVKAMKVSRFCRHIGEGHFPCIEADHKGLNLRDTMVQTLYGLDHYRKKFGAQNNGVRGMFHFDYQGFPEARRRMETFLINTEKMYEVVYS